MEYQQKNPLKYYALPFLFEFGEEGLLPTRQKGIEK
jgi:hypothetical protein